MKTVIEMWHKTWPDPGTFVRASAQDLERFAELVRADEREALAKDFDTQPFRELFEMAQEAGFHEWYTMPEEHPDHAAIIVRFAELVRADAIADEREACAQLCDELHYEVDTYGAQCAAAIRARGQ